MKLWVAFLLVFAVGCGSVQTRDEIKGDVPPPSLGDEGSIGFDDQPASPGKSEHQAEAPPVAKDSSSAARRSLRSAIESGNDEAIHKAASVALAESPNDLMALNAIGFYHYRKFQYLAAQYFFNRALKLNPNSSEINNNMGLVSLALKQERDAIKHFRRAIELDSRNAVAAANVGALYIQNRDYTKGLTALEIAYPSFRKDLKVLNNYGVALTANQNYSKAESIYKDALKINSGSKEVLFNYAVLLIDHLKKYKDGMELLNKIRFLGLSSEMRSKIILLENTAKAGLQ